MKFEPTRLEDGSLRITVTVPPDKFHSLAANAGEANNLNFWQKTDYCVSCKGDLRYTIETYGDIAANIEAAITCMKATGDPSYGLSKGRC